MDLMFQQQQQQQQTLVVEENMSNLTSTSGEASGASSGTRTEIGNTSNYPQQQYLAPPSSKAQPQVKRKRNLPGKPDLDSEVIALSPKTLMTSNRFICEICKKGFQRDQNLQLHRRGHNLPWKLKQKTNKEIIRKKVYVCPEGSCVHHEASRALGDLTGIKKHFCRKHGEKKWKCEKCSKKYAVQSDWKAHSKTCGTREYRCDCGTLFSRRDSFITHRAFCDALIEESARGAIPNHHHYSSLLHDQDNNNIFSLKKEQQSFNLIMPRWHVPSQSNNNTLDLSSTTSSIFSHHHDQTTNPNPSSLCPTTLLPVVTSPHMSATALLQKAAQMGATITKTSSSTATAAAGVSHSSFIHHVMLEGTSFENAFGGILNSNNK